MDEYHNIIEFVKDRIEPVFDLKRAQRNKIFVYDRIQDQSLFNSYNDFVKLTLGQKALLQKLGYLRGECFFIFTTYDGMDAFGGVQKINKLPLVGISSRLFERIYEYCDTLSISLEQVLIEKKIIIDVGGTFGIPLQKFIFSAATSFLFWHEVAHVIQNEEFNSISNLDSDNSSEISDQKFCIESHIDELDADQFAASMTCKDLIMYYGMILDPSKRTPDNFSDLIAITLLGISVLFHVLSDELSVPFYLRAGTHPHHAIRIKNTIEIFENVVKNYVEQQLIDNNLPADKQRFDGVDFSLNMDRMTNIYVAIIVHVIGTHERFLDHIISENRPREVQEYLDEMISASLVRPHTLISRNIW